MKALGDHLIEIPSLHSIVEIECPRLIQVNLPSVAQFFCETALVFLFLVYSSQSFYTIVQSKVL